MERRRFLAAAAATASLAAGCTDGGSGSDGNSGLYGGGGGDQGSDGESQETDSMAADATVVMKNTAFQTLKATVDVGATVKWVNEDGFSHTVTSARFHDTAASWSLDRRVSAGGSTTYTFEESGVYEYYCTIHGKTTMCGAVLVGGATLDESLPCASSSGSGDSGGDDGYYSRRAP